MASCVRPLRPEEVPTVVGWMNARGWNMALQDIALAQKLCSQGFLAIEKDGQLAGKKSR